MSLSPSGSASALHRRLQVVAKSGLAEEVGDVPEKLQGDEREVVGGSEAVVDASEQELVDQIRSLQSKLIQRRIQSGKSNSNFSPPIPSLSNLSYASISDSIRSPQSPQSPPYDLERKADPEVDAEPAWKGPRRLIIVANRLPLSVSLNGSTGAYEFVDSSGGLVSALNAVRDQYEDMTWIGWPGAYVKDKATRKQIEIQMKDKSCVPVWIKEDVLNSYYSGYANSLIWPLFHYIPLRISEIQSSSGMWKAYQEANRLFASKVVSIYRKGDIVWVHDYHLMLLPAMLRATKPSMRIGFFLHTPFPSSEIYRVLPQREELLNGLLASDLVGFHTYDYSRHFSSACTKLLGSEVSGNRIRNNEVLTSVGTFPIGIDAERFLSALSSTEVQDLISQYLSQFSGRRVLVGIDRLDLIKGIPHKLYAMERFLDNNPEWVGKVVLVQIAIPTRTTVKEYQELARETHELVGRINGKFGSLSYAPIVFLDQSIPFNKMCALFHVADVCICTSLRDGMNLISYEYIVCQKGKPGVLILSEFAGAAQSLGAGCLRVNPWDVDEVAHAISDALLMGSEETKEYLEYAQRYVVDNSSASWANRFISTLEAVRPASASTASSAVIIPPKLQFDRVINSFLETTTEHRLIILGLVGTVTQKRKAGFAYESYNRYVKMSPETSKAVETLAADSRTSVLIITSRGREICDKVCGHLHKTWQAAENGFLVKSPEEDEWKMLYEDVDLTWMNEVSDIFGYYCRRTPGSFIEQGTSYITWHYRDCDPEFGEVQSRDLVSHLRSGPLSNTPTEVIHSSKLVQVRPSGLSKGHTQVKLSQMINTKSKLGFVMCVGNFLGRDEDVFTELDARSSAASASRLQSAGPTPRVSASSGPLVLSLPSPSHSPPQNQPQDTGKHLRSPSMSFSFLAPTTKVFTVSVGAKASPAKNFVRNVAEVETLLRLLASELRPANRILSRASQPNLARSSRNLSGDSLSEKADSP